MITPGNIYQKYCIVLHDGRHIYLAYNAFTGPFFFYDKHFHRPITDYLKDPVIIHALLWFLYRGCKA